MAGIDRKRRSLLGLACSGAALALLGPLPLQARQQFSCTDTAGLSPMEVGRRRALRYTDESPKPPQFCDNCQFFLPPQSGEVQTQCGGCTILPGPVHPKGWCQAWAAAPGAGAGTAG